MRRNQPRSSWHYSTLRDTVAGQQAWQAKNKFASLAFFRGQSPVFTKTDRLRTHCLKRFQPCQSIFPQSLPQLFGRRRLY